MLIQWQAGVLRGEQRLRAPVKSTVVIRVAGQGDVTITPGPGLAAQLAAARLFGGKGVEQLRVQHGSLLDSFDEDDGGGVVLASFQSRALPIATLACREIRRVRRRSRDDAPPAQATPLAPADISVTLSVANLTTL